MLIANGSSNVLEWTGSYLPISSSGFSLLDGAMCTLLVPRFSRGY